MAEPEVEIFKTDVRQFEDIESQIKAIRAKIKPLNEKVKELTTTKNKLKTDICGFMGKNEIDSCNMNSGKLQYKETKAVKPITKGDICDSMTTFFSTKFNDDFRSMAPDEKAKTLHTFIYQENREFSDTQSLLRRGA